MLDFLSFMKLVLCNVGLGDTKRHSIFVQLPIYLYYENIVGMTIIRSLVSSENYQFDAEKTGIMSRHNIQKFHNI